MLRIWAPSLNTYLASVKLWALKSPWTPSPHNVAEEYIIKGYKGRKSAGAVFLAIQKAFDRVWYTGLLYKLIKINTPPHLIKVISSYLCNRTFSVRVNSIRSTNRPVQWGEGVPQGSLLASTLFDIYVNDISRTRQTSICMYAHDISICAKAKCNVGRCTLRRGYEWHKLFCEGHTNIKDERHEDWARSRNVCMYRRITIDAFASKLRI
ncbi:RNA-directed DNA polymerase from mobile element jockey [Trichonephila clavipes]|nr:RNA-directed DNA polymerase from mobile element jockey [Trichonephila clavipes]